MNKLWLIIRREFLTRVRKRSFILATILTPLAIGLLVVASGLIMALGSKSSKKVVVVDENQIVETWFKSDERFQFDFADGPLDLWVNKFSEEGYQILIHIPLFDDWKSKEYDASFYADEKLSLSTIEALENRISNAIKENKITRSGIDQELYASFETHVILENGRLQEQSEGTAKSAEQGRLSIAIGTALGGIMGFFMYMVIFIYGGMVMRSVMEEKMNRIVEVMISTVKPFQLMLGKIIGVGATGFAQLAIWLILIPLIIFIAGLFIGPDIQKVAEMQGNVNSIAADELQQYPAAQFLSEFKAQNWGLIIPAFILFFLGGYFIYSSMFAAIGSAIGDDLGESQGLMIPIMIPVILGFVIMPAVLENPSGELAIFGSLFPLFSPIVMPARLAFDPPLWQVLLSIALLLGTAALFIWLSGRIYRIGILMYGKKVSLKELGKWVFYRD